MKNMQMLSTLCSSLSLDILMTSMSHDQHLWLLQGNPFDSIRGLSPLNVTYEILSLYWCATQHYAWLHNQVQAGKHIWLVLKIRRKCVFTFTKLKPKPKPSLHWYDSLHWHDTTHSPRVELISSCISHQLTTKALKTNKKLYTSFEETS